MNKFGVKKLMAFALIAITAIACFAAMGVVPEKLKSRAVDAVAEEDVYLDIGLDFENGWHLIRTAEDYYTMTQYTGTGQANGAKFKLMNDITIDSRKANMHVFSNASLDGNGHNIIIESQQVSGPVVQSSEDLQYESDIKAGATISNATIKNNMVKSNMTYTASGTSYGTTPYVFGYSLSSGGSNTKAYVSTNSLTIEASDEVSGNKTYIGYFGLAVGGVFGVLQNSTITNCYVSVSGAVTLTVQNASSNYRMMLGGLAGASYNSNVSYCAVDYGSYGYVSISGSSSNYCGGVIGYVNGGSVTKNFSMYTRSEMSSMSAVAYGGTYNYNLTIDNAKTSLGDKTGFSGEVAQSVTGTWTSNWKTYKWVANFDGVNDRKPIQVCFVDEDDGGDGGGDGGGTTVYRYVTFKANGGTGSDYTQTFTYGETKALTANTFTRSGYKFKNWNTMSGGGGTSYTDKQTVTIVTNTTLYAQWESVYTLTFLNVSGGTYSTIEYSYNNGVTLPSYSANGYKFNGWICSKSSSSSWSVGQSYTAGSYTSKTGNATFEPDVKATAYTLTLDLNGGSWSNSASYWNSLTDVVEVNSSSNKFTYTIESTFKLPATAHVTNGTKVLSSWKPSSSAGSWAGTATYNPGSSHSSRYGTVTLVAQWGNASTYELTFNMDGGSLGTYNPSATGVSLSGNVVTYLSSSSFGLPTVAQTIYAGTNYILNYFTRTSATSGSGWTLDSSYDPGETITGSARNGDATLKAIWKTTSCNITIDANGGSGGSVNNSSYTRSTSSQSRTLTAPTAPSGKTFSGWKITTNSSGYSSSVSGNTLTIAGYAYGNITVQAQWKTDGGTIDPDPEPTKYTLTINPNGGTWGGSTDTQTFSQEAGTTKTISNPTRTNYTFDYWSKSGGGTLSGTTYTFGTSNCTLTAQWTYNSSGGGTGGGGTGGGTTDPEPTKYTLTLNKGTGIYSVSGAGEYEYNESVTINAVKYSGYSFDGWYNGSTKVSSNEQYTFNITSSLTLTAKAIENSSGGGTGGGGTGGGTVDPEPEPTQYTITYILNGGSASGNPTTYTSSTPTFTLNNPTRRGYTFTGWTGTNLSSQTKTVTITQGSTGDRSYTAHWQVITYSISYTLNGGSASNRTSYTVEDSFTLNNPTKSGNDFTGWTGTGLSSTTMTVTISNATGDRSYTANWEPRKYSITFNINGGTSIRNYSPSGVTFSNNKISDYTINSVFNLPTRTEAFLLGYTCLQWEVTSVSNVRSEDTGSAWVVGEKVAQGYQVSNKVGDVTLKALWTENTYNIKLNANNGTNKSTNINGVGYTNTVKITDNKTSVTVTGTKAQSVNLGWNVEYAGHKLVGWTVELPTGNNLVNGEPTYGYLYTHDRDSNGNLYTSLSGSSTETTLAQTWGLKILKDSGTIKSIVVGDYECSQTINVYAIWTKIYTLTIDANIPQEVLENDNTAGVYNNGARTNATTIEIKNDYFTQYYLYTQKDLEIFYAPNSADGYRLFYYGYYIENWMIKVGGTYYYQTSTNKNPLYNQWASETAFNTPISSGVNMQYLQGDISATPRWKALTFDVRFVTHSSEPYKSTYNTLTEVSQVTFNTPYVIHEDGSVTNVVKAINIGGYSPIYAHPYNKNNIDDTIIITRDGNWGYRLQYQQYTINDTYNKDEGWYIVVEGYYSPDLYRLELNLQLPYTEDNDFTLNNNGYTIVNNVGISDLQEQYASMIIGDDGYEDSANYTARQGNIYIVDGKYYIYLLQDQIIQDEIVYDRYLNGKVISNPTLGDGKQLPNFEIAYYQMQYYYTLNTSREANIYQIGEVDNACKEYARLKLVEAGAQAQLITENDDWKYAYCDVNLADAPKDFKLNVYWYRNIIDVNIRNLLDSVNSINGYTLVTETEQVIKDAQNNPILKEHNKYHLIIYTLNTDDIYEYVTYAFDTLSLLKDVKYEYSAIKEMFDSKTSEQLNTLGTYKSRANSLPIYFGNSFKVEAVDQREDHSMDEFIGYRFEGYNYQITNKGGNAGTCTYLAEYDSYVNSATTSYAVIVDLQGYEYGKDGNTTNYFTDKDQLNIDVKFDRIQYTFNYKTTDDNYNVQQKYGNIRFNYPGYEDEDYDFSYVVTVNSQNQLKSKMLVRLGTELLRWDLRNTTLNSTYTYTFETNEVPKVEIIGQTVILIMDAQFLRVHLYDLAVNANPYEVSAEQFVGDVNAVCQDIAFDVKVNIQDLSTNTILQTYMLSDENLENMIFTLNSTYVSIDNTYTLTMLTKQGEDSYIFYYQDEIQYALRNLYIAPSINKSDKLISTTFAYPAEYFSDILMPVTNELLDGCINYSQFTQVDMDNRVINFYVEVAPTYTLTFKIKDNIYDIFKGTRQLSVENVLIAQGVEVKNDIDASKLKLANGETSMEYLGYWGQQTLFNFVADRSYYKSAKLTINVDDVDDEMYVDVNGNGRYVVTQDTQITIELIPQTYTVEAYIEYQGEEYNITDEYKNERKSITELVNASGVQIFNNVSIDVDPSNAGSTTGVFYPGDKIYVGYTLNNTLANDFNVTIYNNGVGEDNFVNDKVLIEFGGANVVVKMVLNPNIEAVTLTTNMPEYEFGEIYVQVNAQEAVKVDTEAILELINGDQLTIYVKEAIAYEFLEEYHYSGDKDGLNRQVSASKGTDAYEGYKKFVLFEGNGFNTSLNGVYTLKFRQVPINIEFNYYTISPVVEEVDAGSDYMSLSDTEIIQKGSVITLTQGKDKDGYRFEDYSYGAPSGDDRKELELTISGEKQQQFTITDEILEHIDTQSKLEQLDEGELGQSTLTLVVYVNYIEQYMYTIQYINPENGMICAITDVDGNAMGTGKYYDYGTEFIMSAQTQDTEHYMIEATIQNDYGTEQISTNQKPADLEDIKETNKSSLSGFTIKRVLNSNHLITLKADAESYNTILKLNMNKGDTIETIEVSLQEQGEETTKLTNTIYYSINATHIYGSEVKLTIYVVNTPEVFDEEQYYIMKGVSVNEKDLKLIYTGAGMVDQKACNVYEVTYQLTGTDLPVEQELNILFNAMYYVDVKVE